VARELPNEFGERMCSSAISRMVFGFQRLGRLVFRCMSQMEVQKNPLHNVLNKVEFLSKSWFCWLMRGMMKSLKILRAAINSSQSVYLG